MKFLLLLLNLCVLSMAFSDSRERNLEHEHGGLIRRYQYSILEIFLPFHHPMRHNRIYSCRHRYHHRGSIFANGFNKKDLNLVLKLQRSTKYGFSMLRHQHEEQRS